MMIFLSLLVCIAGALVYAFSANPKLSDMGRLAFFAGLLAFLLGNAGPVIDLLHK